MSSAMKSAGVERRHVGDKKEEDLQFIPASITSLL